MFYCAYPFVALQTKFVPHSYQLVDPEQVKTKFVAEQLLVLGHYALHASKSQHLVRTRPCFAWMGLLWDCTLCCGTNLVCQAIRAKANTAFLPLVMVKALPT